MSYETISDELRRFFQDIPRTSEELLLVAVSGGGDSMCLLHSLLSLRESLDVRLGVAHFHHQSRGDCSQRDADFVQIQAEAWGLPFYLGTADVPRLAKERKQSFELCARELRYDFLRNTLQELQGRYLLTAHQAEDNLETFLLNLARGTGLQGLGGIPPQQKELLRPFLRVSRGDIAEYRQHFAVPCCEDESNSDPKYRRNFVRQELLPPLVELNPQVVAHSVNTIRIIREENDYLWSLVAEQVSLQPLEEDMLPFFGKIQGNYCDREEFLALPPVLQWRGLQYLLESVSPRDSLSQAQRTQALALVKKNSPSSELFLSPLLILGRSYDKIYCTTVSPKEEPGDNSLEMQELFPHRPCGFGLWELCLLEETPSSEVLFATAYWEACWELAREVCVQGLFVRSRREGDVLTLPHRPKKTLKKWMIEKKIPKHLRDALPVLVNRQNQVLAVLGLGVSQEALPSHEKVCVTLRRH